jgi:hypothetical protein
MVLVDVDVDVDVVDDVVDVVGVDVEVLVVAAGGVADVVAAIAVDVVVAESDGAEGAGVAAAFPPSSPDVQAVSATRAPTATATRTRYVLAVAVFSFTSRVLHPHLGAVGSPSVAGGRERRLGREVGRVQSCNP